MKDIKRLGITTQEGFEVQNLQRFPSMEFGEEGGMQADVYFKGNHIMRVYQEGNGGCAVTYRTDYYREHRFTIERACLEFLQRVDENYGPDSSYEWLKNKKVAVSSTSKPREDLINDDDWEALVYNIEEYYDDTEMAKKAFRRGAGTVIALYGALRTRYLQTSTIDFAQKDIDSWLNKNDKNGEYSHYRILKSTADLSTL